MCPKHTEIRGSQLSGNRECQVETDRQTGRQTERQVGRLTETETDILVSQLVGDGEGQVESVVLC